MARRSSSCVSGILASTRMAFHLTLSTKADARRRGCTNLLAGYVYCVSSQVAVPPSYAASGIDKKACTGYTSKVMKGQTCSTVAKKYGVSKTRLMQLNTSLNSKCSNIVVGKSYCITSIGS